MKIPQIAPDVEPGNIDLSSRKILINPDGTISSISSMSVGFTDSDGKSFTAVIPTVLDGHRVSRQQAIENFRKTGQHLGKFSRQDDADVFSKNLSEELGQRPREQTMPTIFDVVNKSLRDFKR